MKTTKNYLASAFFSRLMAAALLCLSLAACDTVDPYSDIDAADADLRTLETLTPEQLEAMTPEDVEALIVNASKQASVQPVALQGEKSPVEGAWDYRDEQDAATSHGNVAFTTTGQIRHLPLFVGTVSGSTACKDFEGRFFTFRLRTINLIGVSQITITNSRCETLMEEDLITGLRVARIFKMREGNLYLGTDNGERDVLVLQEAAAEENDGNDDTYSDSDDGSDDSDDGGTYSDEGGSDDSDGGAYSDLPGNDDGDEEENEEK